MFRARYLREDSQTLRGGTDGVDGAGDGFLFESSGEVVDDVFAVVVQGLAGAEGFYVGVVFGRGGGDDFIACCYGELDAGGSD